MTENEMNDSASPKKQGVVEIVGYPKFLLPLLLVLMALTLINLLVSIAVLNSKDAPELPDSLDSEIARENLGSFFRKAYNDRDDDQLHNWLDPIVRLQIDAQKFKGQMAELRGLFPNLEALQFASYECSDQPSGIKSCRLYYSGMIGGGKKVLLTIFVHSQGSEKHRIQGFTLTSQQ